MRVFAATRYGKLPQTERKEGGGASPMGEPEERTQEAIHVRQVTEVHGNYNKEGEGEPGKFSLQLILDEGAEEHVLRIPAEDVRTLMLMLDEAESIYFDTERGALILRGLD